MPQILFQNYKFSGEIRCGEGGPPMQVGDNIRLFLNVSANPDFPVSVDGTVVAVKPTSQLIGFCRRAVTLYSFTYDSDQTGEVLVQNDILKVECVSCCEALDVRVTALEEGGGGGAVQSVAGKTGVVTLDIDDIDGLEEELTGFVPLAIEIDSEPVPTEVGLRLSGTFTITDPIYDALKGELFVLSEDLARTYVTAPDEDGNFLKILPDSFDEPSGWIIGTDSGPILFFSEGLTSTPQEGDYVAVAGATGSPSVVSSSTPGTPAVPGQVVSYPGESAVSLPDGTFQALVNKDASNIAPFAAQWREAIGLKRFSVMDFGASGSGLTTTGSITSGSSVVSVSYVSDFLVGQGLLIKGAGGTIAGHTVGKIVSIVGNQITIDQSATATVSGAVVQHDDTEALNACYAAAHGVSSTAWHPVGHYRCNGYFDSSTASVLKIPFEPGYTITQKSVMLLGEGKGWMDEDTMNVESGGVTIDFSDVSASGINFSGFSGAPYIENPDGNYYTQWNNSEVTIDGIQFVLDSNPTIHGLCLKNTLKAAVGDRVSIIAKAASPRSSLLLPGFAEPTHGTVGLYMPAVLNSVKVDVGAVTVFGFGVGIASGEHCDFRRPQIGWCRVGLLIPTSSHVTTGVVSIENSAYNIQVGGSAAVVDMTVQLELAAAGSWWTGVASIFDPSNVLKGVLRVQSYNVATSGGPELVNTGAQNVVIHNLRTNVVTGPGTPASSPFYASDAAADADTALPSKMPYRITGSRVVSYKP